jgi:hypothetical protein
MPDAQHRLSGNYGDWGSLICACSAYHEAEGELHAADNFDPWMRCAVRNKVVPIVDHNSNGCWNAVLTSCGSLATSLPGSFVKETVSWSKEVAQLPSCRAVLHLCAESVGKHAAGMHK